MENNKKFELNDEALDSVAGGRDGFACVGRYCVRNPNYACSSCGGHEFYVVDGYGIYYSGNCTNCGTHNSDISRVDDNVEFFIA